MDNVRYPSLPSSREGRDVEPEDEGVLVHVRDLSLHHLLHRQVRSNDSTDSEAAARIASTSGDSQSGSVAKRSCNFASLTSIELRHTHMDLRSVSLGLVSRSHDDLSGWRGRCDVPQVPTTRGGLHGEMYS